MTFGLGRDPLVTSIVVEWPSGATDRMSGVAANQFVTVQEGGGLARGPTS